MAPEIADSDGESDVLENHFETEQQNSRHTPTIDNATPVEQISPPQIDFDDFLDPTQALSEQSTARQGVPGPGTGSTERILRGLATARHNLAGSSSNKQMSDIEGYGGTNTKRRHSASEGGPSFIDDVPGKKKRVKTYGSKSRSGSTIDLYADVDADTQNQMSTFPNIDLAGIEAVQGNSWERNEGQEYDEVGATTRERDRPRRVISLLGQHMSTSGRQLSTTMSSYGGYQSIELDFRGAPNGIDVNANPFTGLSQVLVDGEGNKSFQADAQKDRINSHERLEGKTVPSCINPAMIMQNDPTETFSTFETSSKRRKTENLARGTTSSPAPYSRRAASVSAESVSTMSDKPQPKNRGLNAKSSKLANFSQQESMAPPDVPEAPPFQRSRRGTLDSSEVSHDETPSNTKRKRKKSKPELKPDEDSPTKHPSSELHLDDEKIIGLPKEKYKPRPSRRRTRPAVEDDQAEPHWTDPPPDKLEDSPTEPILTTSRKSKGKAGLEDFPHDQPPTASSSSPPKPTKKPKKSKVKRAKTSAAALLKKSSQMLSDGEDDVLWVDEKPAAVKLDLPADLTVLKQEHELKPDISADTATPKRKSKITVEIPIPGTSSNEPSVKESEAGTVKKKRGRPKKSHPGLPPSGLPPGSLALDKAPTPEPLTDAEGVAAGNSEEDVEEEEDEIKKSTRAPLKAKDSNALPTPIVSPAKLPVGVNGEKENAPPQLTPAKANASTPSPTKGPTSHSPIQPASAWNSKSRYRVGLSKRQSIPSLLRRVDKTKAAPTKVGVKVKERKIKVTNEDVDVEDGEGEGGGNGGGMVLRDKDGNLVEWEF